MEQKKKISNRLRMLFFISTCMLMTIPTSNIYAQVKLPDTKITVAEAFKILQTQARLSLIINPEYLDMGREVDFGKKEGNIEEIIQAIVQPQGLSYKITDTQIIILPPGNPEQSGINDTSGANIGSSPDQDPQKNERVSYSGKYSVISVDVNPRINHEKAVPMQDVKSPTPVKTVHVSKVALKTNFLYAATLTPNAGIEFALGKKSTMDISGGYNFYKPSNGKRWRHWLVQPEYRYWFCERFNGFFLGGHLLGGQFNFSKIDFPFNVFSDLKYYRYEGEYVGGGIVFGHQWMLGKRINLELAVGAGYARVMYDKYGCNTCGPAIESGNKNYFGPTKASLSLLFFL